MEQNFLWKPATRQDGVVKPFAVEVATCCTHDAMTVDAGCLCEGAVAGTNVAMKKQVRGDSIARHSSSSRGLLPESPLPSPSFELGVHVVVAEEFFFDCFLAVKTPHIRAR